MKQAASHANQPNLNSFSRYYSSEPRKAARAQTAQPKHRKRYGMLLLIAVLLTSGGAYALASHKTASPVTSDVKTTKTTTPPAKKSTVATTKPAPAVAAPVTTQCSSNTLSQAVIVSISQRHMWACESSKVVYDSPVVTGMEFLAADRTPTGTYYVTGKYQNLHLRGSDSTGSWDDPVSYWMPFLHNQYGSYGFHDATWRADSAFGNIDPNSPDASHGCVELPLSTAAWLFNWGNIGLSVTINS